MSPFQIAMLVVAAGLLVSVVWEPVVGFFKSMKPSKPSWVEDIAVDVVKRNKKTDLLEIVACWEQLRNMCEKSGMKRAADELDNIWPLLLEERTNVKND